MPDEVATRGTWSGSILAGFVVAVLVYSAGFVVLDSTNMAFDPTNLLVLGGLALVAWAAFTVWIRTR